MTTASNTHDFERKSREEVRLGGSTRAVVSRVAKLAPVSVEGASLGSTRVSKKRRRARGGGVGGRRLELRASLDGQGYSLGCAVAGPSPARGTSSTWERVMMRLVDQNKNWIVSCLHRRSPTLALVVISLRSAQTGSSLPFPPALLPWTLCSQPARVHVMANDSPRHSMPL